MQPCGSNEGVKEGRDGVATLRLLSEIMIKNYC